MPDEQNETTPVAIRIKGGSNIRLDNNTSVGMPLLEAENIKNLSGTGNRAIALDSSKAIEKKWFEKPLGIIVLGIVITVIGGGLLYYLGWH